jgi:hypothetical protein
MALPRDGCKRPISLPSALGQSSWRITLDPLTVPRQLMELQFSNGPDLDPEIGNPQIACSISKVSRARGLIFLAVNPVLLFATPLRYCGA